MRRRSKQRVVWLPGTNALSVDVAGLSAWNRFDINVTNSAVGEITAAEVPIVIDAQSDPLATESSLSDVENSGYRLKRIVGKIYLFLNPDDDSNLSCLGVTAGFIIRRSDPTTGASLALTTGNPLNISTASINSQGDPWIWRRSWMLQNVLTPFSPAPQWADLGNAPATNFAPGYALGDGPHIDQKTARVVSSEERLFLDVTATVLLGTDAQETTLLTCFYETRVLATMMTGAGNRRNASR